MKTFVIDKSGIIKSLPYLIDYSYQQKAWLSSGEYPVSSFIEDYCYVFVGTNLFYALEYDQPVFGEPADQALRDLYDAVSAINDKRAPIEVLNDPLMQTVREKAAQALELIQQV